MDFCSSAGPLSTRLLCKGDISAEYCSLPPNPPLFKLTPVSGLLERFAIKVAPCKLSLTGLTSRLESQFADKLGTTVYLVDCSLSKVSFIANCAFLSFSMSWMNCSRAPPLYTIGFGFFNPFSILFTDFVQYRWFCNRNWSNPLSLVLPLVVLSFLRRLSYLSFWCRRVLQIWSRFG